MFSKLLLRFEMIVFYYNLLEVCVDRLYALSVKHLPTSSLALYTLPCQVKDTTHNFIPNWVFFALTIIIFSVPTLLCAIYNMILL